MTDCAICTALRVYGRHVPLWSLKPLIERGVERFLHVYDFGDDWRSDIFIESVRDGEADVDPASVDG